MTAYIAVTGMQPGLATDRGFAFIQQLAAELSGGKVELPSFPDVAMRVRQALADEKTTTEQLTRIVGSEPALAARLLKMANSAALNRSGRPVTELRGAITRMGHNMIRSIAISFAMTQIRGAAKFKGLEQPLGELWNHSTHVAACCFVLAKGHSRCNADEAFLAGLLHGIGRLYILTRAGEHPAVFGDAVALEQVMRDWHAAVAKAILESWQLGEQLVAAIADQDDIARDYHGFADLTDVLICANMMTAYFDQPADLELNMQGIASFRRLNLDGASAARVLEQSREEIAALRQALGT